MFLANGLLSDEDRQMVWETNPQISPVPFLCEVNPLENLSEKRMLKNMSISTSFISNKNTTKLLQIFHPTLEFSLHTILQKMEIGILEHCLTLMTGKG